MKSVIQKQCAVSVAKAALVSRSEHLQGSLHLTPFEDKQRRLENLRPFVRLAAEKFVSDRKKVGLEANRNTLIVAPVYDSSMLNKPLGRLYILHSIQWRVTVSISYVYVTT
jgi:hypothetical protein